MENEGFIDSMINSVKYSVSDLGALFWGGVVAILCMFLVGIPFMFGYITRCARNLLAGDNKLPGWGDWGTLLKDGIMVLAIAIVYGLIGGLLYLLVMPFFVAGDLFGSNLLLIMGVIVAVPVLLIEIALSMLFYLSWMEYAVSGDLAKAINPVRGLRMIAANPLGYILLLVALFLISLALAIPSVLIITIPWVTFVTYAATAYLYVRFYRGIAPNTSGGVPATIVTA